MCFRLFLRCSALVAAGLIGSPPAVSAATTFRAVKDASRTVVSSGTIIFPISEKKLEGGARKLPPSPQEA